MMSDESRRVLEIEEAADYADSPIHEWSDGVIAEYRTSAKALARQVEALEADVKQLQETFMHTFGGGQDEFPDACIICGLDIRNPVHRRIDNRSSSWLDRLAHRATGND